jgi:PAS domain S-box-containing protein
MAAPSRPRRDPPAASLHQFERPASSETARDPDGGSGRIHGLLTAAVEEAARLLAADGAMVYLTDPTTGRLRFAHDAGIKSVRSREWIRSLELAPGVGMFGRAVAERAVVITTDYPSDTTFRHASSADRVVDDLGIRSMVVAPMILGDEVAGALGTFSQRPDAFDAAQIALVRSLADHAASAIANNRLIEELDRSRDELDRSRTTLARRAAAEQALREVAARITALRDPAEILQEVVELASRLVGGEGAILDLLDGETGDLRWAYDDGLARLFSVEEQAKLWISVGKGATGIAVAEDRVVVAGDDLAQLFPPGPENFDFYERTGFRSMIAAPITGETGPLGVIEVYAVRPHAFVEADGALIRALASQAAIAITNARLITELAESKAALAHTADAERTLRGIAARVSAILDPTEVLDRIVQEAARLLDSDGSRIDLWDQDTESLLWAYSAGEAMADVPEWGPTTGIKSGQAVAGLAFAEQRPIMTPDYLADDRFETTPAIEAFIHAAGIRAVIAVPLTGEDHRPLGVLSVVSREPGAYSDAGVETLTAMATHAAIAIGNAKLVEALARTQADVARKAESERSLRQIAARITALTDPDEILQDVVDAARRLLRADGAHLTRIDSGGGYLVPAVVAGGADEETRSWLIGMRFPLGGGINGLAAQEGEPVWTSDYETDPRISHEPDDQETARRMGLVGMAAAPLRAPGGEVIGTLAISTRTQRVFEADELDLLQGLADQAAIALTNSKLLARVTLEEARYRFLVQNAPDVIWSIGADARLTFLSDAIERLTGFRPDELLGEHFGALVHESSEEVAELDWTLAMTNPTQEVRGRLNLRHRDGSAVPAEFIAIASLGADGKFAGANGSVRDMRERDRLERELVQSEERYRFLIQNSPDIVFSTDAEGRFTFLSDAIERMLGTRADDAIGQHFSILVDQSTMPLAGNRWAELVANPEHETQADLFLKRRDGQSVPVDVRAIGIVEDGKFAGIQGATRDVSDQVRLEGELRRQAGELAAGEERAHLARELHDSVTQALFSMALVSRSIEMLLDRDTEAARAQLGQLRELQREALAEMRALIFELRPGNLEQEGLVRALKTHAAALQGRLGLPIVVDSDLPDRLPLPAEEVLYRIAQETLHNVVKHASARQVRVDVRWEANGVRMRVEDDGKGFDPAAVPDGHLGLAGMRARAERVGAGFSCTSRVGEGTTVEVVMGQDLLDRLAATADVPRPGPGTEVIATRDG